MTLVECKNEIKKFNSENVKKIVQTMEDKGCKSIVLFLNKGLTEAAQMEIDEQLMYGKYIIVITKQNLEEIDNKIPYELLLDKIKEIELKQEKLIQEF